MKYTYILILILSLFGCGGGTGAGGVTTAVAVEANLLQSLGSVANESLHPVLGRFQNSSTQHVILANLRYLGSGKTEPGPVKIYQLNDNGTVLDVTVNILGGAVSAWTSVPLVADFNHDGIDDIFLAGSTDMQDFAPSMAFISRSGQSHVRVDLPDPVWSHGSAVIDVNIDGHLDVMDSWGNVWFNDGTGSFTFRRHTYRSSPGFWINGSGICAGDFNNSGRQQVVLTDQMVDPNIGPIADTVIFELGPTGLPVAQHYLPVPVLDRNSTTKEVSHDITCRVADLNNDGLLDIMVMSRPWAVSGSAWTNEGVIQTLINRGNWQFEDTTDTSMIAYNRNVSVTYTPVVVDLNNDGKLDLWASGFDSASGNSNQALINSAAGVFRLSLSSIIGNFGANGGMLPVKFGDRWALFFLCVQYGVSKVYFTKPIYSFD